MQILLTPAEFAGQHRVSARKVQQAIRGGILPAILVGKEYRIDPSNTGTFVRPVEPATLNKEEAV